MSPERPRAKFPPEDRPLPPIRTLRGEAEPVAERSAEPAGPVRSGLTGEPLPLPETIELPEAMPLIPTEPEAPASETADVFAGLEIRTEPPADLPDLPVPDRSDAGADDVPVSDLELGGAVSEEPIAEVVHDEPTLSAGPESVPDTPESDIIMRDGVFWMDEAERREPHVSGEPVEGLTSVGDVGRPIIEPPTPVTPRDPWVDPDKERLEEDLPSTEWEALGQPLEHTLSAGEEGGEGSPSDPAELASRLEKLAEQIRMEGSAALEAAESSGDDVEAELARTLAELMKKKG